MSDARQPAGNEHSALRIEELLVPAAFTHAVTELRLVETHISWVVLTGPYAYKIKKPLKLDFIDGSTLQRREHHCNEELRLNRRLAPELYLRVVPITRQDGQARVDGAGQPIEWAVCLQQFPAEQELPALLERGDVSARELEQLGETLARFHLQAPALSASQAPATTQHMYEMVLDNLEQLRERATRDQPSPDLRRLWDWIREAIADHESDFETRARRGLVRECHGDLHAANIVRIGHQLLPFDCIEFDPRLRWIDVMSDIAFLVMDLHSRERQDLATVMLNRYLEVTGDYDGVRVLPFYAIHSALVRAKVNAITVEQSPHLAKEYAARLQRRIRTAITLTERPKPILLLMHGLSGSGKTWLSEQLIAPLQALRIRSDVERKRLTTATTQGTGFKQGRYSPETSHRVYASLVEHAESCLQTGLNVIVDAAFLDASDRELFTGLASRLHVTCVFISCHADPATLLNRVAARLERGTDASEAAPSVVNEQLRDYKPLGSNQQSPYIQVDTRDADAVEMVLGAVRSLLAS